LFAITVSYYCCLLSCWAEEVSPTTRGLKALMWM